MPGGIDAIKPAGMGWAITPSDSTIFKQETRAIFVGGAGNVVVWVWNPETAKWSAETYNNVPAGTQLAVQTSMVMAATTATLLTGMA